MSPSNAEFVRSFQRDPLLLPPQLWPSKPLWSKQRHIVNLVWRHPRVAVRSGNGIGKTYTAANLSLLFLYAWPNSKVITTAPTWKQVEKILWAEIAELHRTSRFPLGGTLNKTDLTLGPEWMAFGISTRDAVNFQGHHTPHILVIMDEADGVDARIDKAVRSVLTSEHSRLLKIGNPYSTSGHFYDCFHKDAALWVTDKISCYDSPNLTEGRVVYPELVTQEWVDLQIAEYGADSPWVECFIRGEFPKQGDNALINLEWVVTAMQREEWEDDGGAGVGVDVARFGGDETVLVLKRGGEFRTVDARVGQDTMETAGKARLVGRDSACAVGVDDTGVGGGVTDRLNEINAEVPEAQRVRVVPFVAGGRARDESKFSNQTAEAWWMLRELLRTGRPKLQDDQRLLGQLTSRRYHYNSRGQLVLESKDEMKKRGLKSPDRADALAIANYVATPSHDEWDTFMSLKL